MVGPGGSLLSAAAFLALLLLVAVFTFALRRRIPALRMLAGRGRRLRVIERLELGDRRFLALVQIDDREVLIGGSPGSVALLSAVEPAPGGTAESPATAHDSFAAALGRILGAPLGPQA